MDKYNLFFHDCIMVDNAIWFSAKYYNGLYRYDLVEGRTEWIGDFSNETMLQKVLYYKVCKYQNYLIFIPCNAKKIVLFDIKKRVFKYVDLAGVEKNYSSISWKYMEGTVYQDSLYLIGCTLPVIVKVDLKSFSIEIVFQVNRKQEYVDGNYFGIQTATNNNLMYIPCCFENSILVLDMNTDKISWIKVGEIKNCYSRVLNDGWKFYLLEENTNCIIFFDKEKNLFENMDIKFKKKYTDALMCFNENYIWIISINSGEAYQINKMDYRKCNHIDFEEDFFVEYVAPYREGICFVDGNTGKWYYVNEEGQISRLAIRIKEPREKEDIWRRIGEFHGLIEENKFFPMQDYICYGINKNRAKTRERIRTELGREIWDIKDL
ncbi:hypothetical protein AALB51_03080 [Lachnospiraceae bacterium 62-26]